MMKEMAINGMAMLVVAVDGMALNDTQYWHPMVMLLLSLHDDIGSS